MGESQITSPLSFLLLDSGPIHLFHNFLRSPPVFGISELSISEHQIRRAAKTHRRPSHRSTRLGNLWIIRSPVMENTPVEKLHTPPESLELQNGESVSAPSAQSGQSEYDNRDDFWCEDDSVFNGSDDDMSKASDLDREWKKRHNQFHTMGYRDGIMAGKEKSAQEGFNVGFKQSVIVGYNWGLVRGVTSALACLPDHLKEKVVKKLETRDKLHNLYGSVHSISTNDALKLFHEDITSSGSEQIPNIGEGNDGTKTLMSHVLSCNQLGRFSRDLESLLLELPDVEVCGSLDGETAG